MTKEQIKKDNFQSAEETSNKRKILRERAAILAEPITSDGEIGAIMAGMEFFLADERYLIDMNFVVEVIHIHDLTPIPCCPPFIMGIMNVRGRILSVISLKLFLDLPEKGITNHNQVIIVRRKEIEVGLLVDEVVGETSVCVDQLFPAISTLSANQKDYLIGVKKDGSLVLDIAKLLADNKIVVEEEV